MNRLIVLIVLLVATSAIAGTQVGVIGNENELGGWFGVSVGNHTMVGIDGRWLDKTDDADDGVAVSAIVLWEAVPKFELPVNGLIPQINIPGLPEKLDVALDIGGRIGIVDRSETDPLVGLIAQLRINPDEKATIGIRYEYVFDDALWSDIGDIENQHQAFLVLNWRF